MDNKIIKQINALSNESPRETYKRMVRLQSAKQGAFTGEATLAVFLGVGGFVFTGATIGAVVGAGLPLLYAAWKVWDGYQGLMAVESGEDDEWVARLNGRDRKRYEREVKAIAPSAANAQPHQPALPGATLPPWAKDWNPTQKELWDRLIKDCPQMTLPIFSKLVVVSGPQQTGKSSLASAIAYCRFVLRGDPTIAVTPHADGKKVFSGLLVGAGGDFEEIQAWYEDLTSSFKMGGDRRTILIDELSQYTGDWEKLGQNIVRTALTESDKHGYSPILINHAQTVSAGFSGIPGVKALIDSSAIRILRQYELATWGEQIRSKVIKMELPSGEKLSSTVPDWFHLPTLQKMAPVSLPQPEAPEWLEQELVQSGQIDEVAKLNKLLQTPSEPNPFDAKYLTETPSEFDSLPYDLKAIANYAAKQNGWIKARDIQRNVTGFNGYSATQIRMWFCDLSRLGVGSVDGDEHTLKYRV